MTVADAARNSAETIAGFDGSVFMAGCMIDKGTWLLSGKDGTIAAGSVMGIRVEAGGSLRAGSVVLRHGAVIRALPEGGFVIEDESAGTDPQS